MIKLLIEQKLKQDNCYALMSKEYTGSLQDELGVIPTIPESRVVFVSETQIEGYLEDAVDEYKNRGWELEYIFEE